ncbi:MAG: fibronectin type III domain-containing protein [Nitrospira sp.]|nr:fibronectin type III domain-containing protein [Nitrospira sp.]
MSHGLTTPQFWQIFLGTTFIWLGFASGGLACHDAASTIRLTPTSLTFNAVQGATNPPNQTIAVSRPSTWSATFTTSDNASWLTVSPAATTITTSKTLTAAANTAGLVAGTYSATITTMVGTWCKNTEPVTLIVSPGSGGGGGATSSATLRWNAVTSTTISGYKVYVGEAPRQYSRAINVGTVTASTVSSLTVGRTYYFAVTAYNSAGESSQSTEVSKTIQ